MSGHHRATRLHLNSILGQLWRAHVARKIARERGTSQAAAEEKIRLLSKEALLHGLTPIELKIKLEEMAEQTSEMFGTTTKNGATMTKRTSKKSPYKRGRGPEGWVPLAERPGKKSWSVTWRGGHNMVFADTEAEARKVARETLPIAGDFHVSLIGMALGKRAGMKANMDRRDLMAMIKAFPEDAKLDEERMTITFMLDQDEGEPLDCEFRFKFGVCGTCGGKGKHVNPSIDSHGITAEEFAEDPDFQEEYMSGTYDVTCAECGGQRVVPVIDEERADKKCLDAYNEWLEAQYDYARTVQSERDYGA